MLNKKVRLGTEVTTGWFETAPVNLSTANAYRRPGSLPAVPKLTKSAVDEGLNTMSPVSTKGAAAGGSDGSDFWV